MKPGRRRRDPLAGLNDIIEGVVVFSLDLISRFWTFFLEDTVSFIEMPRLLQIPPARRRLLARPNVFWVLGRKQPSMTERTMPPRHGVHLEVTTPGSLPPGRTSHA